MTSTITPEQYKDMAEAHIHELTQAVNGQRSVITYLMHHLEQLATDHDLEEEIELILQRMNSPEPETPKIIL